MSEHPLWDEEEPSEKMELGGDHKKNYELNKKGLYVVDCKKYARQVDAAEDRDSERLYECYKRYKNIAAPKQLATFPYDAIDRIKLLSKRFPHAVEALSVIESQIHLQLLSRKKIARLNNPILLHGPPGTGKTKLATELAKMLSPLHNTWSLGTYQEAFAFSGLDTRYSSSEPGKVAQLFKDSDYANPWIILDEFEKGTTNSNHRPSVYVPFYTLLENHTAKQFEDIALELEIDASNTSWILTANNIDLIPEPLISRCLLFKLNPPDKKQVYQSIIPSIWNDILASASWKERFSTTIPASTRYYLAADLTPREIRNSLLLAAGYAAQKNSNSNRGKQITLEIGDIKRTQSRRIQKKIGFV